MNAAALLKAARDRSGLTQAQVAERAGVHESMVWQYEKGRRRPTVATLDRLLKAAGWQLIGEIEPLGADLDARIERALAVTSEERARLFRHDLDDFAAKCKGVPFAIDGLVAALIQGAPVEATAIDVLLADVNEVLATLGPGSSRARTRSGSRSTTATSWSRAAIRLCGSSIRADGSTSSTSSASACVRGNDSTGCCTSRFGEITLPVIPLWELELDDPAVAAVLARTREILAARRAAEPGNSQTGEGS